MIKKEIIEHANSKNEAFISSLMNHKRLLGSLKTKTLSSRLSRSEAWVWREVTYSQKSQSIKQSTNSRQLFRSQAVPQSISSICQSMKLYWKRINLTSMALREETMMVLHKMMTFKMKRSSSNVQVPSPNPMNRKHTRKFVMTHKIQEMIPMLHLQYRS